LQHIPTKLDHEHEFIAGALALDFANTIGGNRDRVTHDHLVRYADLVVFAQQAGQLSDTHAGKLLALAKQDPVAAGDVLRRGVGLREAIWKVFGPREHARAGDLAIVSEEAARAAAHLRLERQDDDAIAFVWGSDIALDRVLWPIARSAAELLTSEMERATVRECESETCSWLFLDRTRNHSRRWCDMGDCGNRAKARRFRERRRAKGAARA